MRAVCLHTDLRRVLCHVCVLVWTAQDDVRAHTVVIKSGVLLMVIAQDYDDCLVPVIMAHTPVEGEEDWDFLFDHLMLALPTYGQLHWTREPTLDESQKQSCVKFVSDLGKGLAASLRKKFPSAPVAYCIEHRKVRCRAYEDV